MTQTRKAEGHIPKFTLAMLHPRYWPVWLGLLLVALVAFLPHRMRDALAAKLGHFAGRKAKRQRRRAEINLDCCFPEMTASERAKLVDKTFATAAQVMLAMTELALRSKSFLDSRTRFIGFEHVEQVKASGRNIIFMVPHAWAIDFPGIIMASKGMPIAAMFNPHDNLLVDWIWNRVRLRFGGRLHTRQDGIKAFLSSVRQGYCGYYLPDQDHGAEKSEFVDFFATYKATLPGLGKMMKVCNAAVIPLFPVYNSQEGVFEMHIRPPMDDLQDADPVTAARRMNEEIEILVRPNPEQYIWFLKLLKTRKEGEISPYESESL
ncbi:MULTISPECIES: lauroyl-Kdo(2)-lipid IV(A) myristoyltransferase [Plesiomonas]|uniref:lauroyl-Kdo(2)-lipid IV(A) myristoyltransferase n=1 Tax=Plesiomonas TaxID=702 RepID=UPI00057B2A0F|nr:MULTISPECIES: lauroyl-Kdo(2)-lipid IV(A) myristoyltransferase [Plesiomonas]